MPIENSKADEIKRLTTPLTFKNSKAYDDKGNIINCTETINDVRYILEPKEGVLSENEILQYAPKSKAAARIKLKNGVGSTQDVLLIHESLPWILGLYYIILVCITVSAVINANKLAVVILLILFIIPLIYLYRIFNLNTYRPKVTKKQEKPKEIKTETVKAETPEAPEQTGVASLMKYEKEVNNLKLLFNIKEEVVRDLIEKRFTPPQITYDKFISIVDNANKLFYKQAEAASNIINLAAEDTPRVQDEIKSKIAAMHTIIDQIEKLTNELVINISNEDTSSEEVKNLLDEMENLTDSVKKY